MKKSLLLSLLLVLLLSGCVGAERGTLSPTESLSPEGSGTEESWGVTLEAVEVSPSGVTIRCSQSGGAPTGQLQTGSYYVLETKRGDVWEPVEMLPQEYDVAWTDEAWEIPMEGSVEWEIDWAWLYGKLEAGTYRVGKQIMDFRDTGDHDTAMYYAEFAIVS